MAGQKNFEVDQNATFSFVVEYKDNNDNAIDLTGASAKMQVKRKFKFYNTVNTNIPTLLMMSMIFFIKNK